jgi:hypothetical protein
VGARHALQEPWLGVAAVEAVVVDHGPVVLVVAIDVEPPRLVVEGVEASAGAGEARYARHQRLGSETAPVIGADALLLGAALLAGALGMAFEGMLTFGATLTEALALRDTDALTLGLLLALALALVLPPALPV